MSTSPTDHRPWSMPTRRWSMAMNWYDLAFLHWPLPAAALAAHIPAGLQLDTYGGEAWLGLVPFGMSGVRHRWTPALPWVSKFLEFNVRTYVKAEGKPGVWFFSLDAANPLAVRVARSVYHLPYFDARMSISMDSEAWISYDTRRTHRGAPAAVFRGRYRGTGESSKILPGSLEHWLTERYCLYAADRRGKIWRGEIQHQPWPLERGEVQIEENTMAQSMGIDLSPEPAVVHFSKRIEVIAWTLKRVRPAADSESELAMAQT